MVKVEMLNNTLKQIPALDKFVQGWAIFSPRITGLIEETKRTGNGIYGQRKNDGKPTKDRSHFIRLRPYIDAFDWLITAL